MAIPMKLDIGPGAKNIPVKVQDRMLELSYNGIEIMPKDLETFPMPWDAVAIIEGDKFILEGGAGPSGVGRARTEIPVNRVNQFLEISITANDEESARELEQIFLDASWL